jgi:hypothetical protein
VRLDPDREADRDADAAWLLALQEQSVTNDSGFPTTFASTHNNLKGSHLAAGPAHGRPTESRVPVQAPGTPDTVYELWVPKQRSIGNVRTYDWEPVLGNSSSVNVGTPLGKWERMVGDVGTCHWEHGNMETSLHKVVTIRSMVSSIYKPQSKSYKNMYLCALLVARFT